MAAREKRLEDHLEGRGVPSADDGHPQHLCLTLLHSSSFSFWSQALKLCFWPEELESRPIPSIALSWALGDSFR